MFEAADEALYRDKQAGRNRCVASAPVTAQGASTPSDLALLADPAASEGRAGLDAW